MEVMGRVYRKVRSEEVVAEMRAPGTRPSAGLRTEEFLKDKGVEPMLQYESEFELTRDS